MVSHIYKGIRKVTGLALSYIYTPYTKLIFYLNGVKFSKHLSINGFMKVFVTRRGQVTIGKKLLINSGHNHNIIGRQQKTIFWVEGKLIIGNNVGMSSVAIICNHDIEIGNDVTIGGNTVIYDTDFHSLDSTIRIDKSKDKTNAKKGKVTIKNRVFIGAHSTILKGVTIGENSIIGACSVITKDIPANEIWAGNPAKFIKRVK
ncbi:acyltransferase [Algibacter sp. L1A34]|uniref:acyltransferase n=1 Tax=Algibacter sp. L1A34 TaxID=2686365 RepID=UPI00131EBFA0|nr:acyltransferase [Algibacter sp. L1A34]